MVTSLFNGNRTAATKNGSETTSFAYDNRNRLTQVNFPTVNGITHNVRYQYNPDGQVININNSPLSTDPVRYEYDWSGQNESVFGSNSTQASFVYDEEGRMRKIYAADNTPVVGAHNFIT